MTRLFVVAIVVLRMSVSAQDSRFAGDSSAEVAKGVTP
jgi:hypothetical protein